jgi:hypothetical protein
LGSDNFELRIDLEDFEGRTENVTYSTFNIGDASTKYKLTIGGYSGILGINKDLYCRKDTHLVFSSRSMRSSKLSLPKMAESLLLP